MVRQYDFFAGLVAVVKSASTKAGMVVRRLLVGCIPRQAGGSEDAARAQAQPGGIALQGGKVQLSAASGEQPPGSWPWALPSRS